MTRSLDPDDGIAENCLMTNWTGWQWSVIPEEGTSGVPLVLEQLDADGEDWFADGPSGVACGTLASVLCAVAKDGTSRDWLTAVVAALNRQLAYDRGPVMFVRRGGGVWYHASSFRNRTSIRQHGLDWRLMTPPGIAGSHTPETAGIFLCSDLEGAEWFAGMCQDGPADIWSVQLRSDVWIESAPDSGGADDLMICPEPISPKRIALARTGIPRR